MDRIVELIKQDPVRVKALECVSKLGLPQCYIAAGFVRNLVWDALHGFDVTTPLNDADVIYFAPDENDPKAYLQYESQLKQLMPEINWQVRNQALMHTRNSDLPYTSSLDAMSYWPEQETAVAIRQVAPDNYECIAAFGYETLFSYYVTHNPKRSLKTFENRVNSKGWLVRWSSLRTVP
ncbi:nucleotidyltransferase family protein [Vibrio sp. B513a]|uniref:nucleotidyltransferase family protein n=1 Tax=Vibrio TaxID=662 RepID=UPI0013037409|nr:MULTISPECIES: nucleotidyltransferase family protein [Vibrio]ELA6649898.1 nucleotidyltransferase family protein [Vibrio alginolyticus]MDK9753626.1 nucleotidyltransferase family protein [Vibrio sp. B513a]MDW1798032.1 nucleotidyltransferase family protein [Vibrio sp. Vb2297]MDW1820957.1 nucleotidyltransferase family protein [Vibrio sp. Vb1018]MDW2008156.1 nucleotidyltransferase family protein [Vibrio sp. 431]